MTPHVSGVSLSCCSSCCKMIQVHLYFPCLAPAWLNAGLMCFERYVLRSPPCLPCRSSHLWQAALCSTASCQGLHLRPAMCTSESLIVAPQRCPVSLPSGTQDPGRQLHLACCVTCTPDAGTPMALLVLTQSLSHLLTTMPMWLSAGFLRTAQPCSLCVAQ